MIFVEGARVRGMEVIRGRSRGGALFWSLAGGAIAALSLMLLKEVLGTPSVARELVSKLVILMVAGGGMALRGLWMMFTVEELVVDRFDQVLVHHRRDLLDVSTSFWGFHELSLIEPNRPVTELERGRSVQDTVALTTALGARIRGTKSTSTRKARTVAERISELTGMPVAGVMAKGHAARAL